MKKIKYILVAVLISFVATSCQNWLDVEPKTEIKQDRLFQSESGFKDALMGVYVLMGDRDLYGRELSLGLLEVLAMQYEINAQSVYNDALKVAYFNLPYFDKIWSKSYNTIANINSILNEIDSKRAILKPTTYALIKGEALALRASLHFDLIRMYGYGEIGNRPDVLNKSVVPYVTRYNKEMTEQHTIGQALKFAEQDLLEAEKLLDSYDPISSSLRPDDYEYSESDLFLKNRKSRFNNLAVYATLARLYMWRGDYEKALPYCEKFTAKTRPVAWIDANRYIHTSETKEIDFKLLNENIFTLTSNKLYEKIKPLVEDYRTSNDDFTSTTNYDYFSFKPTTISARYEIETGVGVSDWRYTKFFKFGGEFITYLKYYEYSDGNNRNKVPMITLAEMVYYCAECYYRLGDNTKAIALINEVRVNRGIEFDKNLPATLPSESVFEELVKEWRKEFIGIAGNMFFFYKRLGLSIPNSSNQGDKAFVFPIPMAEIEMGRIDNITR